MRIGELFGAIAVIGIGVWVGSVWWVPRVEKPVAACRPVVSIVGQVKDAVVAISPGGKMESLSNTATRSVAQACLTYAGNFFVVTQRE